MANRASRRRAAAAARRDPAPSGATRAPAATGKPGHDDAVADAVADGPAAGAPEAEALVVTNWFDPGADGEPYAATIRLTGRRVAGLAPGSGGDTFTRDDVIDRIVPGSGAMSISSWVYGLQPGEWMVTARLMRRPDRTRPGRPARGSPDERLLQPASWSWRRWAVASAPSVPLGTRWALPAQLARIPAVAPGSWLILGILGVFAALVVQAVVLAHENLAQGPALTASALGFGLGLIGAKLWYARLHPGSPRGALLGGWAVDGFLVVMVPVLALVLLANGMPVGAVLDATAPGLFLAVAIGRIGCFLTGCCAGRLTRSRWGIWSSDRRVGGRRVPAQLIESLAGVVLALVSWLLIHARIPGIEGVTFLAAMAAYAVIRQAMLRLRAERREFSWRRSTASSARGASPS